MRITSRILEPEKDVQGMLEHLHMTLPPSRRPESRRRTPFDFLKTSPPPSLRCGEDLCFGFTEFQPVTLCKTTEVRKTG
jgi:hypothetical protein